MIAGLGLAMPQAVAQSGERNSHRAAQEQSLPSNATNADEASAEPEEAPETEEISTLRKALYTAVRKARSSSGARYVARDEGFEAIARRHARDMVERGYMAHRSPDGDGPRERVLGVFPDFIGIAGENIAMRTIRPDETAAQTALAAVEAWIDSAPHRKNLLDQRHGHVGIGAADNGRAVYIVMLLASEPSLRPPEPEAEGAADGDVSNASEGAEPNAGTGTKPAETGAQTAPGS